MAFPSPSSSEPQHFSKLLIPQPVLQTHISVPNNFSLKSYLPHIIVHKKIPTTCNSDAHNNISLSLMLGPTSLHKVKFPSFLTGTHISYRKSFPHLVHQTHNAVKSKISPNLSLRQTLLETIKFPSSCTSGTHQCTQ